jgi:hypothetical protein
MQYGTFGIRIHSDFYRALNIILGQSISGNVTVSTKYVKLKVTIFFKQKNYLQKFMERHLFIIMPVSDGIKSRRTKYHYADIDKDIG